MVDFTVLAVTRDVNRLRRLQAELQALGGKRFIVSVSMDEACALLEVSRTRLLLLDWDSASVSCEALDQLLWVNSTVSRPAVVLVLSETYRADLAVTLFQMGIDEYLSMTEHSGQFRGVLERLLARDTEAGRELEKVLAETAPSLDAVGHQVVPASGFAVESTV